jgi:lysophospholipase L1-like esterase
MTIVCIGDSNTNPPEAYRPGWCERADALITDPRWKFVNLAVASMTAVRIEGTEDLYTQLTKALAEYKPDGIFMGGPGTNDIDYGYSDEAVLEAELDLRAIATAAGVPIFTALVPPRFDDTALNAPISRLNARLRNEWSGPFLADFATTMVHPEDYLSNNVELRQSAMDKRAQIAVRELNVSAATFPAAAAVAATGTDAEVSLTGFGISGSIGLTGSSSPAAATGSPFRDVNGDGKAVCTCIGDSNTEKNFRGVADWCSRFASLIGGNRIVVNRAVGGTTAVVIRGTKHAGEQLKEAIQIDRADLVIVASATNDLRWGYNPSQIMSAYQTLRDTAQRAGVQLYVATTPRIYEDPSNRSINVMVDYLNGKVRSSFSGRVLDFALVAGFPGDYQADGIHLNTKGQTRRAAVAWMNLK